VTRTRSFVTPTAHSYPSGSRTHTSRQPCPLSTTGTDTTAPAASAPLRLVRVDAEQPDLGADAARRAACEVAVPRMVLLRVAGARHHLGRADAHRREFDVSVVDLGAEHGAVERHGALGVADSRLNERGGQQRAVTESGIHGSPSRSFVASACPFVNAREMDHSAMRRYNQRHVSKAPAHAFHLPFGTVTSGSGGTVAPARESAERSGVV